MAGNALYQRMMRAAKERRRQLAGQPPPPPLSPRVVAASARAEFKRKRGADLACEVCGWKPRALLNIRAVHVHHITPKKAGGSDEVSNLIALCPNHHAVAHALYGHRDPGGRDVLLAALREAE